MPQGSHNARVRRYAMASTIPIRTVLISPQTLAPGFDRCTAPNRTEKTAIAPMAPIPSSRSLKGIAAKHQLFCQRAHKKNKQHGAGPRQQVKAKVEMNADVSPDRDGRTARTVSANPTMQPVTNCPRQPSAQRQSQGCDAVVVDVVSDGEQPDIDADQQQRQQRAKDHLQDEIMLAGNGFGRRHLR